MKHAIQLIPLFLLVTFAASHPVSGASRPVKVFILAGHSNMEGHGRIQADPQRHGGRGSLEFLVKDAATAKRFARLWTPPANGARATTCGSPTSTARGR